MSRVAVVWLLCGCCAADSGLLPCSENTLMCYVDAALAYAGKDAFCCRGDVQKLRAAFAQLQGCLMPIVGKVNKKRAPTSGYDPSNNPNFADFEPGKPHATVLHPTLLLLRPTDLSIRGGCVALLLPITPQGFNYPVGDARRATCDRVLPAYWDAMAVAMCVHVYDDADFSLWDSFSTTTQAGGQPLALDPSHEMDPENGTDPFLFALYRDVSKIDAIPYGTSKRLQIPGMLRSMSTLSVPDGHRVLTSLRGKGAAAWREFMGTRELAYGEVWTKHAGVSKVAKRDNYRMHQEFPSGDEVRNYMFVERALRNTPLAPLLMGNDEAGTAMAASLTWPETLDAPRFFGCLRDSTAWASEGADDFFALL